MKKFIKQLIIIFLIIIMPIVSISIYGNFIQEKKYEQSFYAELKYKAERLENIKESKIIFIGGSSLAFGLRSDEIEKATNYKVVNFGLYALLGTKVMMDLAIKHVNDEDIIILAPELNKDVYSLMVNYKMLLKCLENCNYLKYQLSMNDRVNLYLNSFSFIKERFNANIALSEPYTLSSFNEYGDIISDVVKQNVLYSFYDNNQLINPNKELISDDFIDYINKYNRKIKRKGAKMFFTFSPTNKLSYVNDNTIQFMELLKEKLDFEILGSVEDFVYHQDYFYDTNYHLNYAGSLLHSNNLSNLIKEKLDIENDYQITLQEKPIPKYELSDDVDYSSYYILKKLGNSYVINGIQDEYKNVDRLIVPESYDGIVIDGILSNSFENMTNLETIILPETMQQLSGDIFINCPNLTRIFLTNKSAPSFVGTGLLNGTNPNCKIYVLESAISSYTTGYTWSNYIKYIRTFKKEEIE